MGVSAPADLTDRVGDAVEDVLGLDLDALVTDRFLGWVDQRIRQSSLDWSRRVSLLQRLERTGSSWTIHTKSASDRRERAE